MVKIAAGEESKGRIRRKRSGKREGEKLRKRGRRASEMRLRLSGRESGETPRKERRPKPVITVGPGTGSLPTSILSNSSYYPSTNGQRFLNTRRNQKKSVIKSTGRPHYYY